MAEPQPRFGCFEIRTSCAHCGNPLVLNGPNHSPKCDSCLQTVEVPPALWKGWLEDLEEDYHGLDWKHGSASTIMSGGFTAKVNYYRLKPRCPECKETLGDEIPTGTDEMLSCGSCSGTLDTFPAPDWLREVLPTAAQVYGAERVNGATASPLEDAPKPIVLSCPQCGGTLKATRDSERIVECAYCNVDVYLPDAVWRKLHPARTIHEWFVRFEGMTLEQREAEAERVAQQEQERRTQERLVLEEREQARRDQLAKTERAVVARKRVRGYAVLGIIAAVSAGVVFALDSMPMAVTVIMGAAAATCFVLTFLEWRKS